MFVQTRAIHKDPEPLRISGAVVLMGDLNLISVLVSCLFSKLACELVKRLPPPFKSLSVLVKVGTEESQTHVFI